jgi:hypothetical protein
VVVGLVAHAFGTHTAALAYPLLQTCAEHLLLVEGENTEVACLLAGRASCPHPLAQKYSHTLALLLLQSVLAPADKSKTLTTSEEAGLGDRCR